MAGGQLALHQTYCDLSVHGQQAVAKFGGLSSMITLDSVLLAVLEADIPQVSRELCLTLDYFWFSSHLMVGITRKK